MQIPTDALALTQEQAPIAQGFWVVSEGFAIQSTAQYALAGEVLDVVKGAWKELESKRVTITGPLNQALRATNDLFREPLATYKDCEEVLKKKMATYSRAAEAARVAAMVAPSIDMPILAPPVAQGVSIRTERRFRLVDESAVPRHLCSPDLRKISALPSDTEIAGVEWYDHDVVTVRSGGVK